MTTAPITLPAPVNPPVGTLSRIVVVRQYTDSYGVSNAYEVELLEPSAGVTIASATDTSRTGAAILVKNFLDSSTDMTLPPSAVP